MLSQKRTMTGYVERNGSDDGRREQGHAGRGRGARLLLTGEGSSDVQAAEDGPGTLPAIAAQSDAPSAAQSSKGGTRATPSCPPRRRRHSPSRRPSGGWQDGKASRRSSRLARAPLTKRV